MVLIPGKSDRKRPSSSGKALGQESTGHLYWLIDLIDFISIICKEERVIPTATFPLKAGFYYQKERIEQDSGTDK